MSKTAMDKAAYYFPHFCNARHDRKIRRLRKELGLEGYGIFFMLLEVLREQADFRYPLQDADLLADEIGASEAKLLTVISSYDLFQIDEEENFFSTNLIIYLQPYFQRSSKARTAALKRWESAEKTPDNAQAMLEHSPGIAQAEPGQCASYAKKERKKEGKKEFKEGKKEEEGKVKKNKYGEFNHILLTSSEHAKLTEEWGEAELSRMIRVLDEGIHLKGYVYKSHYLALRKWREREKPAGTSSDDLAAQLERIEAKKQAGIL